jgi:hypothetical protein
VYASKPLDFGIKINLLPETLYSQAFPQLMHLPILLIKLPLNPQPLQARIANTAKACMDTKISTQLRLRFDLFQKEIYFCNKAIFLLHTKHIWQSSGNDC